MIILYAICKRNVYNSSEEFVREIYVMMFLKLFERRYLVEKDG